MADVSKAKHELDHARIEDRNQKAFDFVQKYINAASVDRAPVHEHKAEEADKRQHALSM